MNQLYLHSSGKVYPCGFLQGKYEIGNVKSSSLEDIWASDVATKFRLDNFNGTNSFCQQMQCKYNCHLLHPSISAENSKNKIRRLDIMIDSYCNLKCVMCTNRSEVNKGFADEEFWADLENNILKDIEEIELVGGEPFVSKDTYRLIDLVLKVNPGIRWCFTTNGHFDFEMLLKKKLNKLNIYSFSVSIDSFDENKFKKIRVDGDLSKAIKTLEALKQTKTEYDLDFYLTCNFLIQKDNYTEIRSALDFQKKSGVPIYFILLREPEEFSILSLDKSIQFDFIKNILSLASEYKDLKLLNTAIKVLKQYKCEDRVHLNHLLIEAKHKVGLSE